MQGAPEILTKVWGNGGYCLIPVLMLKAFSSIYVPARVKLLSWGVLPCSRHQPSKLNIYFLSVYVLLNLVSILVVGGRRLAERG